MAKCASSDRRLEIVLLCASLIVYAAVRIIGLEQFPIFFFCDEAWFGNKVEELLRSSLRDSSGSLLPIFFEKAPGRWFPQISTYFYFPSVLLFGKSIEVIRATSAPFATAAALCLALTCLRVFRLKCWWLVVLLFSAGPFWLMHSRTAFEPIFEVIFFCAALLFYGEYRLGRVWALPWAVLSCAFVAYSHFAGTIVVIAFTALLLISDLAYHLKNKKVVLMTFLLGMFLALPLIFFELKNSSAVTQHLANVSSPWARDKSSFVADLPQALARFVETLNPGYWFSRQNRDDLIRHRWRDRGHISQWMAPLFLMGLVATITRWRRPEYRMLLIATISSCAPVLLVEVGAFRVICYLVSAAIYCAIGAEIVVDLCSHVISRVRIVLCCFAVLVGWNFFLLVEALTGASVWYKDYQLYGMQWGALQLLGDTGLVQQALARSESGRVFVTPNWANGADTLVNFFLEPQKRQRVVVQGMADFTFKKQDIGIDDLALMLESEYKNLLDSGKFKRINTRETLNCPDGKVCYRLASLEYIDDIGSVFERENEQRKLLRDTSLTIGDEVWRLKYSMIDLGSLGDLFDHNPNSLVRGYEANPFQLEIEFPTAKLLDGVRLGTNLSDFMVSVSVDEFDSFEKHEYFTTTPIPSSVDQEYEINFADRSLRVRKIHLSILERQGAEPAHIHIRGIEFKSRSNQAIG